MDCEAFMSHLLRTPGRARAAHGSASRSRQQYTLEYWSATSGSREMLRIYGWKRSRAARCMWVMEELGLTYEQIPLNPHAGETRTPEYLALNPAGKIPTLVHDGFVLTESAAISWYLASTFPGTLLPRDPKLAAKVQQWTSWALTELEPLLVGIMRENRRPKEQIDAARIEAARADVHQVIATV